MNKFTEYLMLAPDILSSLLISLIGIGLIVALVLYVIDVRQSHHTIRRNYPLIGRFRYLLEHLGSFFRQYIISQDREELPFNRAQRSWVYRASKNVDNTQAFGSTTTNSKPGHIIFVNAGFAVLDEEAEPTPPITFGPYCRQPFSTRSFFNISGMSYGALSRPAVLALSHGAGKAGCWMSTGEGSLTPYHLEGNCDVIMQIGTARYGVRDAQGNYDEGKLREIAALPQLKMFELKLSQGAKPGKGGIVPAVKVTEEIAAIRGITPNKPSISPNRHPDIKTHDDLLARIHWLRELSGKPVGIKFVLGREEWFEELLLKIKQSGEASAPDFVIIDSGDGGTGAAPLTLIDDVGMDIRESLPLIVDLLVTYGLRERIKVIASGKLLNPSDVAWALCAGADTINNARGFMFSLGCIQALECNKNSCPTGITTHDPKLQRGLVVEDKAERVANYHSNMVKEVNLIARSCGLAHPRLLTREHARIVTQPFQSVSLKTYYKRERLS
jgi:glutamate synthase domain-containing protein 2